MTDFDSDSFTSLHGNKRKLSKTQFLKQKNNKKIRNSFFLSKQIEQEKLQCERKKNQKTFSVVRKRSHQPDVYPIITDEEILADQEIDDYYAEQDWDDWDDWDD
jgi:hypothetical protein